MSAATLSKDDVKSYIEKFLAAAKFASHFMPAGAKTAIGYLELLAEQDWFVSMVYDLMSLGSIQAVEDQLKKWAGYAA